MVLSWGGKVELSIVTTMYFSVNYLATFCKRINECARKITDNYEIILVNDGSPDNSLSMALALQQNEKRIKVIDLSRNFGHHKAIMTGLAYSKGNKIFLIDSDLEEPPEMLLEFWDKFKDCDVVYGVQDKRKGGIIEKITGKMFYEIFNCFSTVALPKNFITGRLMSRRYVNALIQYKEQELYLGGLWVLNGFVQKPVLVKKNGESPTTYSFSKKMALLVNAITSFSNKPLIYVFYIGGIILLSSLVFSLNLLFKKMFFGIVIEGWTSLIISIWLLGGLTIFSVGIVGIYLSKVFLEVKNRPYSIIKDIYTMDGNVNENYNEPRVR